MSNVILDPLLVLKMETWRQNILGPKLLDRAMSINGSLLPRGTPNQNHWLHYTERHSQTAKSQLREYEPHWANSAWSLQHPTRWTRRMNALNTSPTRTEPTQKKHQDPPPRHAHTNTDDQHIGYRVTDKYTHTHLLPNPAKIGGYIWNVGRRCIADCCRYVCWLSTWKICWPESSLLHCIITRFNENVFFMGIITYRKGWL